MAVRYGRHEHSEWRMWGDLCSHDVSAPHQRSRSRLLKPEDARQGHRNPRIKQFLTFRLNRQHLKPFDVTPSGPESHRGYQPGNSGTLTSDVFVQLSYATGNLASECYNKRVGSRD